MATRQIISNFGTFRHYWPTGKNSPAGIGGEDLYVALVDANDAPVNNIAANQVQFSITPPIGVNFGYTKDLTLVGADDNLPCWTYINNGFYKVRLWGRGMESGANDKDLLYPGTYGVLVKPAAGQFKEVFGYYQVRTDFDIAFAATYVPGSSGDDAIKGCVDVFHWWNRERIDPADAGLSEVEISMRDVAGTNWLSVKKSLSEFTVNNQHLWFNKSIPSGIPGGEVLLVEVKATYKSVPHARAFVLPVRY